MINNWTKNIKSLAGTAPLLSEQDSKVMTDKRDICDFNFRIATKVKINCLKRLSKAGREINEVAR